jgi:hypothetical protein
MITMNKLMTGLLKGRITHWSMLAVVLVAVGLSLAGSQQQHQVGGTFVGGNPGFTWTSVSTPLDPAGRTGTDRVVATSWGADFQALLNSVGADTVTDFVGESQMISRDTYQFTHIGYAQKAGNPLTITAILVVSGTLKSTGPNTGLTTYTVSIYPPTADGFPNLEQPPLFTTPVATDPARRVPIL